MSPETVPALFVYCDAIEHVVVGDVMAPLLRSIMTDTGNPVSFAVCKRNRIFVICNHAMSVILDSRRRSVATRIVICTKSIIPIRADMECRFIFVEVRHQRGHGLGSILSGLFRRIILPFFKANGRTIASKASRLKGAYRKV